jgi:hypothetical protein
MAHCLGRYPLQVRSKANDFLDLTNLNGLVGVVIRGADAKVPSVYLEKVPAQ